jgi:hypothetical protein
LTRSHARESHDVRHRNGVGMIEPRRGPRVIITAWRGSGGLLTHLAKVISRLPELRRAWRFELYVERTPDRGEAPARRAQAERRVG